MRFGQPGQRRREPVDLVRQTLQERTELKDEAGVDCVLAGCAPVHMARRIRSVGSHESGQCRDGRDGGVAGPRSRLGERGNIEHLSAASARDGVGRSRRNDPEAGLGPRQRGLEVEHPLQASAIVERLRARGGAEEALEQLG